MRTFRWLLLFGAIALIASCRSQQQAPPPPAPGQVGTIRDIMHNVIETQSQILFDSVAITVTSAGVEERQPKTEEDWEKVSKAAFTLAEATNLITMPGRRVARPEEEDKSAAESELTPRQIQELINANRDLFLKHAKDLQNVALQAYKVTTDKNVQGLWDIGEPIDKACESCHLEFWYPSEKNLKLP